MTTPSVFFRFLLLVSLPGLITLTSGGAIFTEKQTSQIGQFIQTVMECRKVPGLSMTVMKDGRTWTEGYGVADMSTGRPVSGSTLFEVASLTKAFTVSLLSMFMNESSRVSWDTPLVDILGPGFRLGGDYITSHVTLKDVLTHRTGLGTHTASLYTGAPKSMTLELFEKRVRYLPKTAPFRDAFLYNDYGYVLAARVAEVMGGASWEELLRTRLLQPIRMDNTILMDPEMQTDELATTYTETGGKLQEIDSSLYTDYSPYHSSTGIVSSAYDMERWMHVLLHHGVTREGTRVLSKKIITNMQTGRILLSRKDGETYFLFKPQFPESYSDIGYGFAWFTAQYKGYSVVYHPGGIYGYTSLLTFIKDLDLGIFITTNGPDYNIAYQACLFIFFYITDLLLGTQPWLGPENVCGFPQPWVNVTTTQPSGSSSDISEGPVISDSGWENDNAYLGSFGNKLLGDIIISEDEAGQGLLMELNELHGRLYRTANDSLLLGKSLGPRHFMSVGGANQTLFMTLRFLNADGAGRYRELLFTVPSDPQKLQWSFQRDVLFGDGL